MTTLLRRLWISVVCVACGDAASGEGDGSTTTIDASSGTGATTTTGTSTSASTTGTTTMSSSGPLDTSTTEDTATETTVAVPDAVALYVSSDSTLYGFEVDLDSGALTALDTIDVGSTVGAMTHDRARARLMVAAMGAQGVASYGIDSTGVLTEIGQTPIGMNAVYLSLSEAGPHVVAADYGAGTIGSFDVDAGGAVVPGVITSLDVGDQPHAIVLAPDRRFAFVPHRGGNEIRQFTFDATTGALAAHAATTGDPPPNAGPRHMIFAADAAVAWVVNEIDSTITTWSYDAAAGQLSAPQTISTLPEGADGSNNTGADVHVTPDGRFVYTSNRGHNTLAIFAVQADGSLVAMGHVPTEPHVRDFAIEPTGSFLYAAGRDSGQLASYAIGDDGGLTATATVAVPPAPVWVEAVVLAR